MGTLVNKQYCLGLCMYSKDSSYIQKFIIEITKSFTGAVLSFSRIVPSQVKTA